MKNKSSILMLILVLILTFFISCKKEKACTDNRVFYYYYVKNAGSKDVEYINYGPISQCNHKEVRKFWDNVPSGWEGSYSVNMI